MFLLAPDWPIRSNFTITPSFKSLPFPKNRCGGWGGGYR